MRAGREMLLVLGNQLFPRALWRRHDDAVVFMSEDWELCTFVRHHKQKIALFLAAMRSYADELRDAGHEVIYHRLFEEPPIDRRPHSFERKLSAAIRDRKIDRLVCWEIEDKFFEQRIKALAEQLRVPIVWLESPMFVTPRSLAQSWLEAHRPFMAEFYKWQRRRLQVLVDQRGEPTGGRWSFDAENRKPLPRDQPIPERLRVKPSDHLRALVPQIHQHFADHPGELELSGWWLPTTRREALAWLKQFLEQYLGDFGRYEDALSRRDPWLFHSVLSPMMNLGLLPPAEIVQRTLEYAAEHEVPINSLEGFLRQIIGWREFVRAIYQRYSEQQFTANHFQHHRQLTPAWYDGTTGIVPLDDVIRKVLRYGWSHHIERLMVVGNLMLLCEIEPRAAYRWFMEMYVDSSDWVMGPNVLGMSLFADGGIFATKPYISGSNYVLKMSDYQRPKTGGTLFEDSSADWCDVWDGLYWRFIHKHREFLTHNARMAQMVATFDRMDPVRRQRILTAAETFVADRSVDPTS